MHTGPVRVRLLRQVYFPEADDLLGKGLHRRMPFLKHGVFTSCQGFVQLQQPGPAIGTFIGIGGGILTEIAGFTFHFIPLKAVIKYSNDAITIGQLGIFL
ncbi:hypothetical protein D3C86_1179940 [compost metagenome]